MLTVLALPLAPEMTIPKLNFAWEDGPRIYKNTLYDL